MKKLLNSCIVLLLITAMVLSVNAVSVASVRQNGAPIVLDTKKENEKSITVVVTPLTEQNKASWATQKEIAAATEALNDGDLTTVKGIQDAVAALNQLNAAVKDSSAIIIPGTPVKPVPDVTVPAETVPAETVPGETVPDEDAPAVWTEVKVENLVVSEVFHVTADEVGVAVTFEAEGIREGQFLMVMIFVDGEWVVMDFEDVQIVADGKVRIHFEQYGTVAFVVDKTEVERFMAEDALLIKENKK